MGKGNKSSKGFKGERKRPVKAVKPAKAIKDDFTRICPYCNSRDISSDFSNAGLVEAMAFNNTYKCNHCGYAGMFFPEVEGRPPAPKLMKDVKKHPQINTMFDSNILWLWAITGPLFLLLSVIILLFIPNFRLQLLVFIDFLPSSAVMIVASYNQKLVHEHKWLGVLLKIFSIYCFFIAPMLVAFVDI